MTEQELREFMQKMPHKDGVNPEGWRIVKAELLTLAHFYCQFCTAKNLPILITSVVRPRIEGVSVSDTHAQGRAFDASVRGWAVDDIDDILIECNKLHAPRMGAVSATDGLSRAVIFEYGQGLCSIPKSVEYCKCNGAAPHLHFQVRP